MQDSAEAIAPPCTAPMTIFLVFIAVLERAAGQRSAWAARRSAKIAQAFCAHQLITGEVVLSELRKALGRRIKVPAATIEDILALLRDREVVPKPGKPSDLPIRDPDDRWIFASATAGRADVLVTGDRDLLDIAGKAPCRFLVPAPFGIC